MTCKFDTFFFWLFEIVKYASLCCIPTPFLFMLTSRGIVSDIHPFPHFVIIRDQYTYHLTAPHSPSPRSIANVYSRTRAVIRRNVANVATLLLKETSMFDDKLTHARRLIEQRDQIDQELRVLFGEVPQLKRSRRRADKDGGVADQAEHGNGAAASDPESVARSFCVQRLGAAP